MGRFLPVSPFPASAYAAGRLLAATALGKAKPKFDEPSGRHRDIQAASEKSDHRENVVVQSSQIHEILHAGVQNADEPSISFGLEGTPLRAALASGLTLVYP
jgi:hypothetical protein